MNFYGDLWQITNTDLRVLRYESDSGKEKKTSLSLGALRLGEMRKEHLMGGS